jgi:SAM-dependent methyltransferase
VKYWQVAGYRRNKNLFLEGVEGTLLDRVVRRGSVELARLLGVGCRVVLSEQTVEYPLVFSHLPPPPCRVLDFGCNENILSIQLAALGYDVVGMGLAPYPFSHPNFRFLQADILSWKPEPDAFDCVLSVSTMEHIGLGYGVEGDEGGDRHALAKLLEALRPGGRLIVTVPAGRPCIRRGMRIYDAERLRALIPGIQELRFFAKPSRYGAWRETDEATIASLTYDRYNATSPVQGVAFVVAQP